MTTYDFINSNKRRSFLLMFVFIALLLVLGYFIGQFSDAGYTGLVIALVISGMMTLISWYSGDKIALWTAGAKPIEKQDNAYVYRLVENLCITAGLDLPKIYIISDPTPNAFATGRDPKHASIALTSGIIEKLKNEELEGVIAHELSHIKNYDIRLMMIVIVLVGTVTLIGQWFFRFRLFGGRRNRSSLGGQIGLILLIIGLVFLILSPIFAKLLQFAISRKREYLADASGALLTRYPEGLATALEKISQYKQPLQRANQATAHLYIASPFGEKAAKGFNRLFSTHPPIDERVAALRRMADVKE
ncbi:MAG: M48 family metallopeptidase [Patescibacteria group bacterium]